MLGEDELLLRKLKEGKSFYKHNQINQKTDRRLYWRLHVRD